MTALTNEIIGLVLLTAAIAILVVVRNRMSRDRRPKGPLGAATRSPGVSEATAWHAAPTASVISAFGPAPVWAGGSPGGAPGTNADRGDPNPAATTPEAEPPPVGIMAVPGNSAHASRVMHVSSLRDPAAREMPTAWMVVTPMDLLGERPPEILDSATTSNPVEVEAPPVPPPHEPMHVDPPAAESVVPPAFEPVAPPAFKPVETPPVEEPIALTPNPIALTPNPFEANRTRSSEIDLGMPSNLLVDLLGPDEPVEPGPRP